MTPKLKNIFSFQLKANIWKMELDPAAALLAVESRDGETLEVSYALIDIEKEKLLWDELAFESAWLSGLSGLHQGYMLFYTHEDMQKPAQRDVFALELAKKEVSWAYTGYRHLVFWEGFSVGLSRQQDEEESYARIELASGTITSLGADEGLLLIEKGRQQQEQEEKKYAYPLQYVGDSTNFATVQAFLKMQYQLEAVEGCEYLEIFDKIIISYYTAYGEKLSNYLLVCNEEGELLLHTCMNEKGEGRGLDTFFVAGRKLIFTKEKRIIESYEI